MAEPAGIRLAVCTNSLGKTQAGHTIDVKLKAAKRHGFEGVEVAMECLELHAGSPQFGVYGSRPDRLKAAAKDIRGMASALSLEIIALNPLGGLDALVNVEDQEERFIEADLWLQLTQLLDTPILQVTSAMYPQAKPVTSDPKKIAQNLSKLCLLAQSHGKLVAYEAISWGYNTNTWQQSRDIFHLVDLPNFRHCLDTFHIATKIAADPFNQEQPIHLDGIENLKSSLDELRNDIKPSEIGYMQLSDATVADALQRNYPNQDFNAPPFMTQSRNCRVFPCDTIHQGILPVVDVAKAVFDTGYRGWVSMEVFHTDLWKRDDSIPDKWAEQGVACWERLKSECFDSNTL